MKIGNKKIICVILVGIFLFSTNATASKNISNTAKNDVFIVLEKNDSYNEISYDEIDFDPDVNLLVTVTIKEIRALDKIDLIGDPDFYVKVFINGEEFKSNPPWYNKKYVNETWSVTADVSDFEENVRIKIQLWDWNLGIDKLCDIGSIYDSGLMDKRDLDLVYSLYSGHWRGDDFNSPDILLDPSGYGRANGCDDNTLYKMDRDCELWFDISQNDFDGDGIPYWTELNEYKTDPKVDNTGEDNDGDGVPIEWEHKWGHYFQRRGHNEETYYVHRWIYNATVAEDHANLDPDEDGLQNTEEYLTSQWGSDPFRQDIFLELDQMEISQDGRGGFVPVNSKQLLRDAFGKHNIVFLVDDGYMGGGQKNIPFDSVTSDEELQEIYFQYFLNNDPNYWRRGVFHYAIIIYHAERYCGFAFSSEVDGKSLPDCFSLSTDLHHNSPIFKYPIINIIRRRTLNLELHRAISYASVMMHETGHVLGIFRSNTPGCDQSGWISHIKNLGYKSCMNYFYVYYLIDYSDGSHGKNDYDDWDRIDLTRFQIYY